MQRLLQAFVISVILGRISYEVDFSIEHIPERLICIAGRAYSFVVLRSKHFNLEYYRKIGLRSDFVGLSVCLGLRSSLNI